MVPTGTPAFLGAIQWSLEWEGSTAKQSAYAGYYGDTSNTTRYAAVWRTSQLWNATLNPGRRSVVAAAGSITRIALRASSAFSGGAGYTVYITKNGTRQDGAGGTVNTACALIGAQTASATFDLPLGVATSFITRACQRAPHRRDCCAPAACSRRRLMGSRSLRASRPISSTPRTARISCARAGPGTVNWEGSENFRSTLKGAKTPFRLSKLYVILEAAPGV